jgi:hypothetical protein
MALIISFAYLAQVAQKLTIGSRAKCITKEIFMLATENIESLGATDMNVFKQLNEFKTF